MNSALTSIILLTSLVTVVLLGQRLQRRLPDHHLSADSKDAVKLAIGLVATSHAAAGARGALASQAIIDRGDGAGVLAPANATTTLALITAAISVTSAVFLIMELDQPLGGIITLSGEPMLNVLNLFKMN